MSGQEEPELKAGHPPAVKVGGMRVAKSSKPHHDGASNEDSDDKKAIQPDTSSFLSTQPNAELSGPVTKSHLTQEHGAHVKHYHEPKQPTHDKRPQTNPGLQSHHIFQPK
ncbi:hypothetical protein LOTGIDRAFT_237810 [Lottia gigantea]|uniref:Death-associated protein 1 n=1 Tax=Lottia gigantea TaxID=225164 RepID=V4AGN1_LOTGI|nr:hypothetical protein LOTGIDRAFT_237810 [Lottia gigantea]ESP03199.1 hypothetical protein LOTGIDRAFT_237810 [Lottia gigantea]